MSILIIDAQAAGSAGREIVEWISAGIRVVAGILEEENREYELALVEDFVKNSGRYKDFNAFLISGMSSDATFIKKACNIIKEWKKPLIIGGPITFDAELAINELGANVAILGEGERVFKKLLEKGLAEGIIPENAELGEIESIAYKKKGEIVKNKANGYLTKDELNSLFPSTSIVKYYPFHEQAGVAVEILRGCSNFKRAKKHHGKECLPNCRNCDSDNLLLRLKCPLDIPGGCGFCSVGGLYGPPRSREQELIVKEIKELIENGAARISFLVPDPLDYKREELVAPLPLTDPEKPEPNYDELDKLCKMFWDIPEVADEKTIITVRDVKATLVTEKSAVLLKKYFSNSIIGLGCESGSEQHCMELGRGYSPKIVEKAVEILNKHGIKPKINLIAGLPGQTEKTTKDTIGFIERLRGKVLYFDAARFEALPATAFENCASDFGPVRDENTKKILEKVNGIQLELFNSLKGEEWNVIIGVYKNEDGEEIKREGGRKQKEEKLADALYQKAVPKRKFRQLAGIVGYPLFHKKHLSLMATVVKILNPDSELKTGDIKKVRLNGASEVGFRIIPEGEIVL